MEHIRYPVDSRLERAFTITWDVDRLGTPQIILHAQASTLGAAHPIDLTGKLKALSIRDHYRHITPLLVINGDPDTLMSTQDSVDLANGAARELIRTCGSREDVPSRMMICKESEF